MQVLSFFKPKLKLYTSEFHLNIYQHKANNEWHKQTTILTTMITMDCYENIT